MNTSTANVVARTAVVTSKHVSGCLILLTISAFQLQSSHCLTPPQRRNRSQTKSRSSPILKFSPIQETEKYFEYRWMSRAYLNFQTYPTVTEGPNTLFMTHLVCYKSPRWGLNNICYCFRNYSRMIRYVGAVSRITETRISSNVKNANCRWVFTFRQRRYVSNTIDLCNHIYIHIRILRLVCFSWETFSLFG